MHRKCVLLSFIYCGRIDACTQSGTIYHSLCIGIKFQNQFVIDSCVLSSISPIPGHQNVVNYSVDDIFT